MTSLTSVLSADHDLEVEPSSEEGSTEQSSMPMAGTTYYYNKDPQTKAHVHLATSM